MTDEGLTRLDEPVPVELPDHGVNEELDDADYEDGIADEDGDDDAD
jgi:hypothetical protein